MDISRDRRGRPLFEEAKAREVKERFFDLACVMARLRRDCPWDQTQTPDSLKRYILEEAYETLEAIDDRDWDALRDELGDFMFQVLFQAVIQQEEGRFDIADVLTAIVEKMIRRHPHVFGDGQADDAERVAANWEAIKQAEKGAVESVYDGLTKGMPALLESFKIGKKAARAGFDWPEPERVLEKIEEEIAEVRAARREPDRDALREELGDLLFAMSNLVRKYGFEPEETLRAANRKFVARFRLMERLAREDGVAFDALSLETQERYWERAKRATPPAGEARS